jgi:CheY-like chemotaxis protein
MKNGVPYLCKALSTAIERPGESGTPCPPIVSIVAQSDDAEEYDLAILPTDFLGSFGVVPATLKVRTMTELIVLAKQQNAERHAAATQGPDLILMDIQLPIIDGYAVSDSVPPSPLLSARRRTRTYLAVTTTASAQRIKDSTPSTISRVIGPDSAAATTASRNA